MTIYMPSMKNKSTITKKTAVPAEAAAAAEVTKVDTAEATKT
jgi:hypothetical protein